MHAKEERKQREELKITLKLLEKNLSMQKFGTRLYYALHNYDVIIPVFHI